MIAIIDYGAGNVASVANALKCLNEKYILTGSSTEISLADGAIFPGQGEASFAMKRLNELNLISILQNYKKPLLGICLGMQLLAEKSMEGNTIGLGIINGSIEKFDKGKTKVPHMGWNSIEIIKSGKLFDDITSGEYFYFANSFFLPLVSSTTSTSENKIVFSASVEWNNYYGLQFHPEKSGEAGLKILKKFIELC